MATKEEIESDLEKSLNSDIEARVTQYRDELELQASRMRGLGHSPKEIDNLVEKKREEIKKELMRPQDRDRIRQGYSILMERLAVQPGGEAIIHEIQEAGSKVDPQKMTDDIELQDFWACQATHIMPYIRSALQLWTMV